MQLLKNRQFLMFYEKTSQRQDFLGNILSCDSVLNKNQHRARQRYITGEKNTSIPKKIQYLNVHIEKDEMKLKYIKQSKDTCNYNTGL